MKWVSNPLLKKDKLTINKIVKMKSIMKRTKKRIKRKSTKRSKRTKRRSRKMR